MTRAYAEPDALPRNIRAMLRKQCDGEWDRVTVDDDGAFVVHNNAKMARRFLGLEAPATDLRGHLPGANKVAPPAPVAPPEPPKAVTPPPPRPKREPVQVLEPPTEPLPKPVDTPPAPPKVVTPPPPKAEPVKGTGRTPAQVQRPEFIKRTDPPASGPIPNFEAQVRGLKHMLENRVPVKDSTGVQIFSVPEDEKLQRSELYRMCWGETRGDPDWESIDVEATAFQLQQRLSLGLPMWLPYQFHSEVLALWGMDEGLMGDALRYPEKVEVRPETKEKKYPVLAFYRGDLEIILGMRNPHAPAVIAAYAGTRLNPGGNGRGSTGGGGAKRSGGLPSTTRASIKALRQAGAEIEVEIGDERVEVKYQGNELGKISVGDYVDKQVVQSDYQRMLRKINAINQRVPAR